MTDKSTFRSELDAAIAAYDRPRAVSAALEAIDSGALTIDRLYLDLSETLVQIGHDWQRGTTEVWQEHFTTAVARNIIEACALRVEAAAPPNRTVGVVLAAPSDEYHDLGLRMLTDRFTLAGWRAHFLGANVPLNEVIAAVEELDARAATLSASTHFHRSRLREYTDALAAIQPGVRTWVVGAAFAVEHDGWPAEIVLDPLAVPGPEIL